jgi:hypothetical protein
VSAPSYRHRERAKWTPERTADRDVEEMGAERDEEEEGSAAPPHGHQTRRKEAHQSRPPHRIADVRLTPLMSLSQPKRGSLMAFQSLRGG